MKLTVDDVLAAHVAISGVLQTQFKLGEFPEKLFYRLSKIDRKLSREVDDYERTRVAMVKHFAGDVPEGQPVNVPDDKIPDFLAKIDEVLAEEIELDIQPVPRDLFDGIVHSGTVWLGLSRIIET